MTRSPSPHGRDPDPAPDADEAARNGRHGLGRTTRRDAWWLAPGVQAVVFTVCATYLFVSGILLTPLFGTPVRGRRLPVAVLLAAHRAACLPTGSARRPSSSGSRSASGPPATTTARRTTASTSRPARLRRRRAHASTGVRLETAFPFILQNLHRYFLYLAFIPLFFLWSTRSSRSFRAERRIPARARRRDPVSTSCCSAATRSRATRCATSSGASSTASRAPGARGSATRLAAGSRAQPAPHVWAWASLCRDVADIYVRLLASGSSPDPAIIF